MAPAPASHDAQRELEQRALRNVRGLVDKMETIEVADRHAQRRMLLWILLGVLAVIVALGVVMWRANENAGKPVVIDPAKLPPIRPGPPTR